MLLFPYRVVGLLGAVPSVKQLASSRSDDWIDRMSHIYTVFILIMCGVLVSTGQFVGEPIHCWCPAEFTGAFEAYTRNYCWIKNTYYIPMLESIPIDIHKRQVKFLHRFNAPPCGFRVVTTALLYL